MHLYWSYPHTSYIANLTIDDLREEYDNIFLLCLLGNISTAELRLEIENMEIFVKYEITI